MKTISSFYPGFYSNPIKEDWFYNICKIDNPFSSTSPQRFLYDKIFNSPLGLSSNALEFGVFRGHTLIPTAIAMKLVGSSFKLYGFDTFSGFPNISIGPNDEPSSFESLYKKNIISKSHYDKCKLSSMLKTDTTSLSTLTPSNISTSANFTETSIQLIEDKINFFELDNIELVDGPFETTLPNFDFSYGNFGIVNIDSDLYSTYQLILSKLPSCTSKLSEAFVFLDEYYSLKFPGPRVAVNEFTLNNTVFNLSKLASMEQEFERWALVK
jgi:hypothetical protein